MGNMKHGGIRGNMREYVENIFRGGGLHKKFKKNDTSVTVYNDLYKEHANDVTVKR